MSLFTQCGRALQRRRQNREWRHLMDTVEQREVDDPAERDPALEARLQQNKRIAIKKESDLLERYTMMQDFYPRLSQMNSKLKKALQTVCNASAGSSIASKEKIEESTKTNIVEKSVKDHENNTIDDIVIVNCETLKESNKKDVVEKSTKTVNENSFSEIKVKSEKVDDIIEILEDLGENYKTTVKQIEDPSLVIEISSDSSSDED